MANQCLFVVFDRVAEESGPIFEAVNVGVALRRYKEILNKSNVYPEEYQLLQVGTFDHTTNKLLGFDKPVCHCWGSPESDKLPDSRVVDINEAKEAVNK